MYIGRVAARTGASRKAIRHYEALGLLGPVPRSGSYRTYTEADVRAVRRIRLAQSLGFRLSELAPLAAGDWGGLQRLVERKREQVDAELSRLDALSARLGELREEVCACAAAAASDVDVADCAPHEATPAGVPARSGKG